MTIVTLRMKSTLRLGVLAMVFSIAGCGNAAEPAGESGELWGRTFVSTSATMDGAPRALVPGTEIRLALDNGTLRANAGCNQLSGRVDVDGQRLAVSDLGGSLMLCGDELREQEEWLIAFLGRRPTWLLDGDVLVLRTDDTELRLSDSRAARPDRTLRGVRWSVESIVDGDRMSAVPAGVDAHLTIDESGRVDGSTGCTTVRGRATVRPDALVFTGMTSAKATCSRGPDPLDAKFVALLNGDVTFRIDGDLLLLTRDDGHGLRLRATP